MIDWTPVRRHKGKAAIEVSGGKDSTLVLWLLREEGLLGHVTAYHVNTGDLFPEVEAHVAELEAWCPRFVTIRTDSRAWARANGEPFDLVPYSAHPVGQMRRDGGKVAHRFDCCGANLMLPLHKRVMDDGNTLIIRGTRRADQPVLPVESGQIVDGVEHFYPIQEMSDDEVFAFCREKDVPLPSLYEHFRQAPECSTCCAWGGVDTGGYLKEYHPALFDIYAHRMSSVLREINPCLANLKKALRVFEPHD